MNLLVADPQWGWWIVWYFFLGGIAAACYFVATLLDLFGRGDEGELARLGYRVAFPLIAVCGLLLIADLNRPERFWHMLFRSEVVREALDQGWPWTGRAWTGMAEAPLLKHWSPMSIGSWALALFGFCSSLSFLGSLWPDGRLAWLLRRSLLARPLQLTGCLVGFFVAAYTGALLTATNQPVWSDTTGIAPLFLASAAATGLATLLLLARARDGLNAEVIQRLGHAERTALALELIAFLALVVSLQEWAIAVWNTTPGMLLLTAVPAVGILAPLLLSMWQVDRYRFPFVAAVLSLAGGFLLRYSIVATPPALLPHGPAVTAPYQHRQPPLGDPRPPSLAGFSPEDGREPGSSRGADPNNRPADADRLRPRSKVFHPDPAEPMP